MEKLTSDDRKELTVKEFVEKIKQLPILREILTMAGVWFVVRTVLFLMIFGNVIYIVYRIFNMVLN